MKQITYQPPRIQNTENLHKPVLQHSGNISQQDSRASKIYKSSKTRLQYLSNALQSRIRSQKPKRLKLRSGSICSIAPHQVHRKKIPNSTAAKHAELISSITSPIKDVPLQIGNPLQQYHSKVLKETIPCSQNNVIINSKDRN